MGCKLTLPGAVLEKLAAIQIDRVFFAPTPGRCLSMTRYTEPEADVAMLLHRAS